MWYSIYLKLVGGLVNIVYFPINIGNVIIPINELIFFRGVAQPPTRLATIYHSMCMMLSTFMIIIPHETAQTNSNSWLVPSTTINNQSTTINHIHYQMILIIHWQWTGNDNHELILFGGQLIIINQSLPINYNIK